MENLLLEKYYKDIYIHIDSGRFYLKNTEISHNTVKYIMALDRLNEYYKNDLNELNEWIFI